MGPFLSEFSSPWSCLVCGPQAAGCVLTHRTAGHTPSPQVFWFGQCIPQSLGFGVKVGMFPLGENQRLPRQLVQTPQASSLLSPYFSLRVRGVQWSPLVSGAGWAPEQILPFLSEDLAGRHVPGTGRRRVSPPQWPCGGGTAVIPSFLDVEPRHQRG